MKKRFLRILCPVLIAVLILCLPEPARGESAFVPQAERFVGRWAGEGFTARIRAVEGSIRMRLVRDEGAGERFIWEFDPCWYDQEEGVVVCAACSWSAQRFDPLSDEWEETDWAMDDMAYSTVASEEDGEVIALQNIMRYEGTLRLRRQSEN